MKKKNLIMGLILAGGVVFTSCKKDELRLKPESKKEIPSEFVKASVSGLVVDENENPVIGATVSIDGQYEQTDKHGAFVFKDKYIHKRTHVKIEKTGFMDGHRVFYTEYGDFENVRIKLLSNTPIGNFQTSSGGTITTSDGVQINFPASAITLANGGTYTGIVNVAAKFIDPNESDISEIIPGNLEAINSANERQVLRSAGMIGVELTGTSGEKLQLGNGKKAEITIPLNGAWASSAPSSIPLWHFDETNGIWIEEGSATLVNGKYVGEVSHFSFWNCDEPFPPCSISGCVVDQNGNPIIGVTVKGYDANGWYQGATITDANGHFSGQMAGNITMTFKVGYGSYCSSGLGSVTVGPFVVGSQNQLPCIVVTLPNPITITGRLEDCNGNAATSGYVHVNGLSWYNSTIYPDSAGNFTFTTTMCQTSIPTSIDIQGFDPITLTESTLQTVSNNNGVFNIGTISTCNIIDEFVNFTYNGNTYSIISSFEFADSANTFNLTSGSWQDSMRVEFITSALQTPSTVIPSFMFVQSPNPDYLYIFDYSPTGMNITYTSVPLNVGDYAEGTFNGILIDPNMNNGQPQNISGNFRVKRDY